MKKLLILMVALTMVFGFAAFASAVVVFDTVQSIEAQASVMPADTSIEPSVCGDMGAVQIVGREAPDTTDMTFTTTCKIDIAARPMIEAIAAIGMDHDMCEINDGLGGMTAFLATSTGKGGGRGVYAHGEPLAPATFI